MPAARDSLQDEPRDAEGWHRRGIALADEGKPEQAIKALRRALSLDDSRAEAHNDLATLYYEKGWHAEAEAGFRRAVALKPDHGVAWANLGAALRAQAKLTESRRAFQRALWLRLRALLPRFLQWKVAPEPAQAQVARAKESMRAGDPSAALAAAETAVRLAPASAAAHAALSTVQRESRADLAEQSARKAVELDPGFADAHDNLGLALWKLKRLDEAEKHAREAVRLSSQGPGYQMNLALILKDAGKINEARELYRAIARTEPAHVDRCLNLAALAMECDADLDAARSWYAKAQRLGDDPRVRMSLALVDLLEGRFASAWPLYEARKRTPERRAYHSLFSPMPEWDGAELRGKRLLVYGEQGLGDEVMFASMIPDLTGRVADVTLACDPRLEALFRRSFPAVDVVGASREALPPLPAPAEVAVAAGSLGQYFRRQTADFPSRSYLVADGEKVRQWRERLAALGPGRTIGLSWRGGEPGTGRARRSLALEQLRPLLEVPGTRWVSLQYGEVRKEAGQFSERVHFFPNVADDLDAFAALVGALDVVVSVCNATVHIAGAIGKEVLVMAPFLPEWRYGMRGERMLWYPSARVLRQSKMGDWDSVLSAVKARLQG